MDNNNNEYSGQGSYQNQYQNNYQNSYQSPYQNMNTASGSGYGSNSYQNIPTGDEKNKKKKEKRVGGFGTKLAKCAALALVFGLVSGTAFEGVRIAGNAITGTEETASETTGSVLTQTDSSSRITATSTSSQYVATDVSDIVESVMPSIVAITNVSETEYQSFWGGRSQTYESTSAGSGIIVAQDNDNLYIATNNHVVDGATSLTVTFCDDSTVSAEIKGTDPSTDLAVIRVARSSIEADTLDQIKVATLGSSDELRVGEASIAIGNALGYGQSVTTGCISALNREVSVSDSSTNTSYTAELIQTDAAINPGNSGGALLNAAGEVIGINSVKYSSTEVEGIGYAIPIDTAMPIIEDLITKEKVEEADSAYLGIAGVDVTSDVSTTYNMPTGVYVAQVIEGSAAAQAGIQKGDIITSFDGKEISSMEELSTRLQYYTAGSTVDVVIQRVSDGEYQEQTISVTLGKKK
jgi:serine protease Do